MSLPAALLALQQRLQHEFANPQLLVQALTHRSFSADHNERLEFLGDSVLNLAVAHLLFERLSELPEGDLSRVRANLVKQDTLHGLALGLGLAEALRLGEGEMRSGGQRRPSILADALEALVAAIHLDAGFEACRAAVLPWFEPLIAALPPPNKVGKDAKTRLQEWVQARGKPLPQYALLEEGGDDHARTFRVGCTLREPAVHSEGEGSSRRAAEQQAADAALRIIEA